MIYILYIILFLSYFPVFAILHVLHFRIFRPKLIFISAFFDGLFAAVILSFCFSFFDPDSYFVLFSACISAFLVTIIYVIFGPLMAERSLTVYLLLNIYSVGDAALISDVEAKTNAEYIKGNQMVKKRLNEQVWSGSLKSENGKIFLTKKGLLLASLYLALRKILKINPKF